MVTQTQYQISMVALPPAESRKAIESLPASGLIFGPNRTSEVPTAKPEPCIVNPVTFCSDYVATMADLGYETWAVFITLAAF